MNRTVNLTQNPDGTFSVASFTNTVELSIGLVVTRDQVARWLTFPQVTVRVVGLTPQTAENGEQLLMGMDSAPGDKSSSQPKSGAKRGKISSLNPSSH